MSQRQIAIPHFTLQHLQVKAITIQMARIRSSTPKITFSGLIDQHIKESMVRITVALQTLGLTFPKDHVTIHFTPAVYEKRGSDYDLALAAGMLTLFGRISGLPAQTLFISELGLNGQLVGSDHFLAYFHHMLTHFPNWIILTSPATHDWLNKHNAPGGNVVPVNDLSQLMEHLNATPPRTLPPPPRHTPPMLPPNQDSAVRPFQQVDGLPVTKTALLVALIAKVPLLLIGPPGVGKTFVVNIARDLLPPLTFKEWLTGHLLSNIRDQDQVDTHPPFQSPHYNASLESFVGAFHKSRWVPGEFSLANGGILFLDEMPHFKPQVLDALRTPLEEQHFLLSRAHFHAKLPAQFVLLGAMNPCPCGYFYFNPCACGCTHRQITTYLSRISGPIRERFALVHLVDPQRELDTGGYALDVTPSDIARFRKHFENRYDSNQLQVDFHTWHSQTSHQSRFCLNKRKEKHVSKVALSLALLANRQWPSAKDWALAHSFQDASTFFSGLGV